MRKAIVFASVLILSLTSTYFPGLQEIYASKPAVSASNLLQNPGGNDLKAKKQRDFKIPDDTEDENTLYDTSSSFSDLKLLDSSGTEKTVSLKRSHLVAIDPGHGGNDPGAVVGGLVEKSINLDIAIRLNQLLKQSGIRTYMIRADDTFSEPKERIYTANSKKASLFVSIHSNWFKDPSFNGTMTLYYPSKQLLKGKLVELDYALIVQDELSKSLSTKNRGVIDRPNLSVLKHANMPSILVELGFMSNRSDAELLSSDDFRQKAAAALARGIIKSLARID